MKENFSYLCLLFRYGLEGFYHPLDLVVGHEYIMNHQKEKEDR